MLDASSHLCYNKKASETWDRQGAWSWNTWCIHQRISDPPGWWDPPTRLSQYWCAAPPEGWLFFWCSKLGKLSRFVWLVVYLPLWNIWVRQLGMMKFPTEWKVIKFHGSKPPTSCFLNFFEGWLTDSPSVFLASSKGTRCLISNMAGWCCAADRTATSISCTLPEKNRDFLSESQRPYKNMMQETYLKCHSSIHHRKILWKGHAFWLVKMANTMKP